MGWADAWAERPALAPKDDGKIYCTCEGFKIGFAVVIIMVSVAQLVRASGCGPEGRGFEPHHSPQIFPITLLAVDCVFAFGAVGADDFFVALVAFSSE